MYFLCVTLWVIGYARSEVKVDLVGRVLIRRLYSIHKHNNSWTLVLSISLFNLTIESILFRSWYKEDNTTCVHIDGIFWSPNSVQDRPTFCDHSPIDEPVLRTIWILAIFACILSGMVMLGLAVAGLVIPAVWEKEDKEQKSQWEGALDRSHSQPNAEAVEMNDSEKEPASSQSNAIVVHDTNVQSVTREMRSLDAQSSVSRQEQEQQDHTQVDVEATSRNRFSTSSRSPLEDLEEIKRETIHHVEQKLQELNQEMKVLEQNAGQARHSGTLGRLKLLQKKMKKYVWRQIFFRRCLIVAMCCSILCTIALITNIILIRANASDKKFGPGAIRFILGIIFSGIVSIHLYRYYRYQRRKKVSVLVGATDARLTGLVILTTIVLVVGALAMRKIEEWPYPQAMMYWIITYTTVGYGNIVPATRGGKYFLYFFGSFGLIVFAATLVACCSEFVTWFYRVTFRFRARFQSTTYPRIAKFIYDQFNTLVTTALVTVLWLGGALYFYLVESGWSYFDATYFCYQTLTTIGYGDLIPESPAGIVFWKFYVFLGVGVLGIVIGGLSDQIKARFSRTKECND